MLKKLKSRRSQTEKWPLVTEDELRALGKDITPDHVLGLRAVTEGELRTVKVGKITPSWAPTANAKYG